MHVSAGINKVAHFEKQLTPERIKIPEIRRQCGHIEAHGSSIIHVLGASRASDVGVLALRLHLKVADDELLHDEKKNCSLQVHF